MTAMAVTTPSTVVPHKDPDASPAFYRDILAFQGPHDIGHGGMRWITVSPASLALPSSCSRRAYTLASLAKGAAPAPR
jgi:hypothetical protein